MGSICDNCFRNDDCDSSSLGTIGTVAECGDFRPCMYVVIGVWAGCLHDVSVHSTLEKARAQRDSMLKEFGLTDEDKPDNQHNPECRWNDENEVHLHTVGLDVQ